MFAGLLLALLLAAPVRPQVPPGEGAAPAPASRGSCGLLGPAAEARAEVAVAARVSVLRGRAMLVRGEDVRILVRDSEPATVPGSAHLELGSRAQVEIAWPGRGSLRVEGPATLEWSAPARGERSVVELERFERMEIEVRSASLLFELPQAWAFDVRRAALAVESLPSGALVVRHHGGEDVRVLSRVPREDDRWPRRIAAGERARLQPSATSAE